MHRLSFVVAVLVLLVNLISSATPSSFTFHHRRPSSLTALNDATCPPCSCFNCLTSPYKCLNFGTCAKSNGKCDCSPGLGGDDCGTPLCGSLASDNRPQKIPGKACDCDAGWTGMNCNVCDQDDVCNVFMPEKQNGTCFKGSEIIDKSYQICQVTNEKFKKDLKLINIDKIEASFFCDKSTKGCQFQLWLQDEQSFYCRLDDCAFTSTHFANNRTTSKYQCNKVLCECIKDRFLCGKDGTIDLTDFFTDEEEGPRGPAQVKCEDEQGKRNRNCVFDEPGMNSLLKLLAGEENIKLSCISGQCIHVSQLPGVKLTEPTAPILSIVLMVLTSLTLVGGVFWGLWFIKRRQEQEKQEALDWYRQHGLTGTDDGTLSEGTEEEETRKKLMMAGHVPMTLSFRNISYVVDLKRGKPVATANNVNSSTSSLASLNTGFEWIIPARLREFWTRQRGYRSVATVEEGDGAEEEDDVAAATSNATTLQAQQTIPDDGTRLVVLDGVQGIVKPGQVMAIMGGSGAGKTTFLDILANKSKSGIVNGEILVNGRHVSAAEYKRVIGFVDQEDHLMDTLTVYETILYSALLRLPANMPIEAKKFRVQETMMELGISAIANRKIGKAGSRGISGGEKRRVSIACELVTSPSILFLDEPTSGLDSYNAYNVVESLVSLARQYQRTVITTIHQPRSNIYALFDQLVLLAKGRVVYSGPAQQAVIQHFADMGFQCPLGFNIADYLVDLTMHAVSADRSGASPTQGGNNRVVGTTSQQEGEVVSNGGLLRPDSPQFVSASPTGSPSISPIKKKSIRELQEESLFTPQKSSGNSNSNLPPRIAISRRSTMTATNGPRSAMSGYFSGGVYISSHLQMLVDGYKNSSISRQIMEEMDDVQSPGSASASSGVERDEENGNGVSSPNRGYHHQRGRSWGSIRNTLWRNTNEGASVGVTTIANTSATDSNTTLNARGVGWWMQFKILSGRTLKNLYRNPNLLMMHYVISMLVAVICGMVFWQVKNDMSGFQNRMGMLFFSCALFGFGCLTSLQIFYNERVIFVRERANRYYTPFTYFCSKVLFDLIPLRVIPPIIFGLISYHMVGFRDDSIYYMLRFLLVLVLFNVTAASICLFFGIVFREPGVANLVCSMVMLFEMLFGGLLLNRNSMPKYLTWIVDFSFFNNALEASLVNEVSGISLRDTKFGQQMDVSGSMVLQSFGFAYMNAAYWVDVGKLVVMCWLFLVAAFIWLQLFVRERR